MQKNTLFFLLVSLFFLTAVALTGCAPQPISSSEPIPPALTLTSTEQAYHPGLNSSYLPDPSQTLTLDQVRSEPYASRFRPSTSLVPNFGVNGGVYWLKTEIKVEADCEWLLEFSLPVLSRLDAYLIDSQGQVVHAPPTTGFGYPFSTRDIPGESLLVNLPLKAGQAYTLYLRAESLLVSFPIAIWPIEVFEQHVQVTNILNMLFYGALLVMVLYNLILGILLRDSVYIYYTIALSSLFLLLFTVDGYAQRYLWPNWVWFNQVTPPLLLGSATASLLTITNNLLKTRERARRQYWLLYTLAIIQIGFALAAFFIGPVLIKFQVPLIMIGILSALVVGFSAYRKKQQQARTYLLSWTLFLVLALVTILQRLGWIASSFEPETNVKIGVLILTILLSLILVKQLEKEKWRNEKTREVLYRKQYELLRVKDELAETLKKSHNALEKQVEERTRDLQALNDQLTREIGERKRTEERLKLFAQAIQQSGSSIFITDTTGKIEFVNPAFVRNTGFSAREALGQNPRIIQSSRTPESVYQDMWNTILDGKIWRGELLNRNKAGEYYWEMVTIAPVRDENGVVAHFVAVKDNISALKEAEENLRKSEERYRSIISASPDNISIIQTDGSVGFASPVAARMFGFASEQEVLGKNFLEFLAEEEHERALQMLQESKAGVAPAPGEFKGKRQNGSKIDLEINTALIHDPDGNISGIVAVLRDVTARKQEERVQKEFSRLLESLNEVSMELSRAKTFDEMCLRAIELGREKLGFDRLGLWFIDPSDQNMMIGSYGVDEFGNIRDERSIRLPMIPVGVNLQLMNRELRIFHREGASLLDQNFKVVGIGEQAGVALWDGNQVIGFLFADNLLYHQPIHERRRELLLLFGQVIGHQGTIKRVQQEQERLASTDPLTGLYNRRYFFSLAHTELKKAIRYELPLSVIILDADHFKKINDSYGHSVGDQALRHVAGILRSSQRETDLVARFGGEEFVILLPQTHPHDAVNSAERIRAMIENSVLNFNGQSIPVTVSLGVAGYLPGTVVSHFDQLLSFADQALYKAKETGRNRVVEYQIDPQ